jgi:hypothetical protein
MNLRTDIAAMFSSDHTRFFEAEITWPTIERLTDNDIIEQVDVQKAAPSAPEESLQTMPAADS